MASYSIINKVFNYSQENAYGVIASYSNQLNLAEFNPESLLARNGLNNKAGEQFDLVELDLKLAKILADYIKEVYYLFDVKSVSELILNEIKKETPNMIMGDGKRQRPVPKNSE